MKHHLCRLLILLFAVPAIAFGQKPSPMGSASTAEIVAQITRVERGLLPAVLIKGDPAWSIEERMKFYKVPGLSVAVIKDFKVLWAKGYGVKDIDSKEPVTTDTLFQAGSISKSVNAMITMKKVEQGKLALDENINNKLVSWKLPDNDFTAKKKVTLRNLLSHTGGTTVHGFPGYAIDEKLPTLVQVLDGAAPANTAAIRVDLEPGTKYRYSGGGTSIIQLALTDIEKKPYPQIAYETVLKPLGMTNSTYNQPLSADWRPKAATGYRTNGQEVQGKIHIYPEMAAAGLWTTPIDLAKFGIEMQLSLAGKSNKVLKKETVDLMTTSFMDNAGLGFFIEPHGKAIYFGHNGADEGFRAELLVSRDKGYGVAVMVNSDNGAILREVMRAVAQEYGWDEFLPARHEVIALDAAKLETFKGRYLANPDRVQTVTTKPDASGRIGLWVQPTADNPVELLPISETMFVRRESTAKYEFVPGALKIFQPNGSITEAKRIGAEELVPFEMLTAGKIDEAIAGYRKIKQEMPDNVTVQEARLNTLGYLLVRQNKMAEAIALLKLNTELYPNAWNTYDSLGDVYMRTGEKELAITNFKKSLELNPENANAKEMLKKLAGN